MKYFKFWLLTEKATAKVTSSNLKNPAITRLEAMNREKILQEVLDKLEEIDQAETDQQIESIINNGRNKN